MSEIFDGDTFEFCVDSVRLTGQLARVAALMSDGKWRTLERIATMAQGSEAGVSARLRDLRKPRFGGLTVERRRCEIATRGLWEYRVLIGETKQ